MEREIKLENYESLELLFTELDRLQNPLIDVSGTYSRYLELKARQRGVPMHGTFELTPLCNLDCKMCYVHLNRNQLGTRSLLTVEQWKDLIDQAVEAGMLDVVLTGGECLTYPGFDEIYLYLQSKGILVTVLTNGVLLTAERLRFFEAHRPKGFQITLYGSSEEEYEAVTGSRCFATVMKHIDAVKHSGIPFTVAITPNQYMLDGGEALVRLVHQCGFSYNINTALFKPREDTGRNEAFCDIETDQYIRLHLLRRELQGTRVNPPTDIHLPEPSKCGKPVKGLLCSGGNSGFFIGWDGRMTPCGTFSGVEAFPLEQGFVAAWKSIRQICCEYPLPQECGNCIYNKFCPSCVMVHCQDAPLGHASSRVCERAKKIVASGLGILKGRLNDEEEL